MAAGPEYVFEMSGGRLCLDFANTVSNQWGEDRRERLGDYQALVAWSRQAGLLSPEEAEALLGDAARRPGEAQAALARAIALRQAIFGTFSAAAAGARPQPADLETLNAELLETLSRSRIVPTDSGYALACMEDGRALDRMLRAVARSAADLLTSPDLATVRECGGRRVARPSDRCTWLFLDRTKNRSRRWCDMKSCGNAAKARRHRERARASARR